MARLVAFYLALYLIFFAVSSSHALQWTTTPPTIELLKVATLPDGGERWVPKTITQTSIVPSAGTLPTKLKVMTYIRRIGPNGSWLWAAAPALIPVIQALIDKYLKKTDPETGEPKTPGFDGIIEKNRTIPGGTFTERAFLYGTSYHILKLGGYESTQAEALAAAEAKKQQLVPESISVEGPIYLSSLGSVESTPTPIYDLSLYRSYRVRQYVSGTHQTTYDTIGWYFLYPITENPPSDLDQDGITKDLQEADEDTKKEINDLMGDALAANDSLLEWEDPPLDAPAAETPFENDEIEVPFDEGNPFGDRLSTFYENVQDAPLFASIWKFFEGPTLVGDPVLIIDMGKTFGGQHRIDFSAWLNWLTTFKAVFLLIVTYSGIRIILGN